MSGSISQTTPPVGGGSNFAMNPSAQANLASGVAQFNSMVKSGDTTGIKSSLQNLQDQVGSDVTSYFGQNNAGLNETSYKTLSGAQYQMGQFGGQVGSGASSLADLSKFGQTFESALSSPPPSASSAAPAAGTAPTAGPSGGAGGDSMSGIAQQLISLLQQVLQQLGQGSAQGAGQDAPAPGGQAAKGGSPAPSGGAPPEAAGPSASKRDAQGGPEAIVGELLKVLEQLVQQFGKGGAEGSAQGAGGKTPAPQDGDDDGLASLKQALGPLIQKLAGHSGSGAAPVGGAQPSTAAASPPGGATASGGPSATQPASQASASTGNSHQAELMQMMSQLLQMIMQMMQSMNASTAGGAGGADA